MARIAIIIGSSRPGRRSPHVARWVNGVAASTGLATFDMVDLADYPLPFLDEPAPAAMGSYAHEHTRRWSELISTYDGYVFVTPEYNHSIPAVLKNSIDYLYAEWADKAVGFVTYGLLGGQRAAEHLRLVVAELKMADVRTQVALSLRDDFLTVDSTDTLTPPGHQEMLLRRLLGEVVQWSDALRPLRQDANHLTSENASNG
jgi:NAD(P)H-dependent FMN reductase